ncbi:MAG: hypothetical protein AVDCRST_MAG35-128, partial [uncultured Quadrisphaera sp.]
WPCARAAALPPGTPTAPRQAVAPPPPRSCAWSPSPAPWSAAAGRAPPVSSW